MDLNNIILKGAILKGTLKDNSNLSGTKYEIKQRDEAKFNVIVGK